jgi:Zn-dependent protease with chaperone function
MTDFFEQQRLAKSKSRKIIFTFVLFVILQFSAVALITDYMVNQSTDRSLKHFKTYDPFEQAPKKYFALQPSNFSLKVAAVFAFVFFLLYISKRLMFFSEPSGLPKKMSAFQLTTHNTKSDDEKMYYNVVAEMALASGVPMPEVFVLRDETAVNAFTSGANMQTANIVVTQGALDVFTRDELQAVVAHEFGHIVSGDVSANIELLSTTYAFSSFFTLGYYLMRALSRGSRYRGRSKKGDGLAQLMIIALAVMVFGAVGSFVSRFISSLFSKQREFLADALSVQFTRYPKGLASALAKIRDGVSGTVLSSANGAEISAICFGSSVKWMSGLFDTHPPLNSRIEKIDSTFLKENSSFKKVIRQEKKLEEQAESKQQMMPKPLEYLAGIGLLKESDLKSAKRTLSALEASDLSGFIDSEGVEYLVYALLFSDDPSELEAQKNTIRQNCGEQVLNFTMKAFESFHRHQALSKFSMIELAAPLFAQVPVSKTERILKTSKSLIGQDGKTLPFEAFLYLFIKKYSYGLEKTDSKSHIGDRDLAWLISVVASVGAEDMSLVQDAKEQALKTYFGEGYSEGGFSMDFKRDLIQRLEPIFFDLARLSIKRKKKLLEALIEAVKFDQTLSRKDFEAFRILCDVMAVPAPPII